MFRIGFDPLVEAEQRNRELIKQVEQYRLAQETQPGIQPKSSNASRILAFIGKGMASLGANLESRYGDGLPSGKIDLNTQSNDDGCIS